MSSVMRCRSDVMESSFTKWNVLQAATPCFRTGVLRGRQEQRGLFVLKCWCYANTAQRFSPIKIMRFDPSAVVGIFPSDHYFSDEAAYSEHVEFMFNGAECLTERVGLLGIHADRPETEYGWIEPHAVGNLPAQGSLRPGK